MNLQGKTALVTGASSGLGRCFAEVLAGAGANLLITARDQEALEALAAELRSRHSVQVNVVPQDLAQAGAAMKLFEQAQSFGPGIDILINNAGMGSYGSFVDTDWKRLENQLWLNVHTLIELTLRFSQDMLRRGGGHILNVATSVAPLPVPGYALYAATKSLVLNFDDALSFELGKSGVHVCTLCPGSMNTRFWERAGQPQPPFLARLTMTSPEKVARIGLRAMLRGRRRRVVGLLNRLMWFFMRFIPRNWLIFIAAKSNRGE